jgi:hypothetical protein
MSLCRVTDVIAVPWKVCFFLTKKNILSLSRQNELNVFENRYAMMIATTCLPSTEQSAQNYYHNCEISRWTGAERNYWVLELTIGKITFRFGFPRDSDRKRYGLWPWKNKTVESGRTLPDICTPEYRRFPFRSPLINGGIMEIPYFSVNGTQQRYKYRTGT